MYVSLFFLIFIVVSHGNNEDIMKNYIQEQVQNPPHLFRSGGPVLKKNSGAVKRKIRKILIFFDIFFCSKTCSKGLSTLIYCSRPSSKVLRHLGAVERSMKKKVERSAPLKTRSFATRILNLSRNTHSISRVPFYF